MVRKKETLKKKLAKNFEIKELGKFKYFLDIEVSGLIGTRNISLQTEICHGLAKRDNGLQSKQNSQLQTLDAYEETDIDTRQD